MGVDGAHRHQSESEAFTSKSTSSPGGPAPTLQVSLTIDEMPALGEDIRMTVTVSNRSGSPRALLEHISAQLKEYDNSPLKSFWVFHGEVLIPPFEGDRVRRPSGSFHQRRADCVLYLLCSLETPSLHFLLGLFLHRGGGGLCEFGGGDEGHEDQRKIPGCSGVQHSCSTNRYRGTALDASLFPP